MDPCPGRYLRLLESLTLAEPEIDVPDELVITPSEDVTYAIVPQEEVVHCTGLTVYMKAA
jgi:hypothetical protein